jgi:hypothetical protein
MVQNKDKSNTTRTGIGRKTISQQELAKLKGHYWVVGRTGEHCTAVTMYKETFALQESNKEMYFST